MCNNIYNRLVNTCILKTPVWIGMSMFRLGKSVTVFGFLFFLWLYLMAYDRLNQRVERQAPKTYTALLFLIGVDNSKKVFSIGNVQEKNCQVFVPVYL